MNRSTHLSEVQLYEVLDQAATSETQSHLSRCSQCQTEMEALQTSLTGLRQGAKEFAQSHFRPRLDLSQTSRTNWFRHVLPSWSLSLVTAGLVCAASISLIHGPADSRKTVETQAIVESAPSQTDDALLDSIDQDLSTSVPPSLAPLTVPGAESAEATQTLD